MLVKGLSKGPFKALKRLTAGFKIKNSFMDCQGAKEEPEGRLGEPGDLKSARGGPPALSPLPGSPGLHSGSSWAPWNSRVESTYKKLRVEALICIT